jgi:hypothetical protein
VDHDIDPETASVQDYLANLDDPAWGAASEVTPKFVAPSDPAAEWTGALRNAAFFGYADNYLIDVRCGIIMDAEASRAIRQAEVGAAQTMIERTEECFGIEALDDRQFYRVTRQCARQSRRQIAAAA